MRTISPELIRAYREAHYIVFDGDKELRLQVGAVNFELTRLMNNHNARTASVLTAYNPFSVVKTKRENDHAQMRLLQTLQEKARKIFSAICRDAKDEWVPEPSFLVLDLTLNEAEILADEFGQNGFIWISNPDAVVELCLRYPSV